MNFKFYLPMLIVLMSLNLSAQKNLWSVTPYGGTDGAGAIYKITEDGSSYKNEFNFPVTGFNGASPEFNTQCQATNGKIYGTITQGGLNNLGLIYSYDISTSTFTALYHFNGLGDGINPKGSLMQASNGKLYGMTPSGGAFNSGIIFSFDIGTGIYTKLFDFNSTNGRYPAGGLIQATNGLLYGMTYQGGLNNGGTIFSYNTSTLTFVKLFDMATSTGVLPFGNFKQSLNGKLYGMTSLGGANNQGAIFSYDISTSTYTKRFDFSTANGYYPRGGLVETTSGLFYGLTTNGGTNADGVIFSFADATTTYTKLHEFNNSLTTNGGAPYNSLVLASNGKLYGTTTINGTAGGGNPFGTIFSYTINTSTYAKVFTFTGTATGGAPQTALLQATNGKLYGLCNTSGNGPFGTAFSWDPSTSLFVKLTDLLVLQVGGLATGSMIKASDGLFYGLTKGGGNNSSGTLYSYNPSSNVLLKLVDLPINSDPEGALVQAPNGKLYGMTKGAGSSGFGSIFSYDISTTTFAIVNNMANATGRTPSGSLIVGSDGNLYGMTTYGGTNGHGVIFKFIISTSTYTKLADFNSSVNGERPYGSLLQASNGLMYGLTSVGGTSGSGVLFEFNSTTNILTKKIEFSTIGVQPWGSLIQATNGLLYGLTHVGGGLNGGTIFSYNISTNTGTKLHEFSLTLPAGNSPYGSLFQSANGKLYGATRTGGTNNLGTVFSYDINTATFTKIHDNTTPDGINSGFATFIETDISLSLGTIPTYLCEGSTINIPVQTNDLFNSGNVFTAQLSNSLGSFASPINIGTLTSQMGGNISGIVPSGLSNSGYKIRIVSSSPAMTSITSPSLTIRPFNKSIFNEQIGIVAGTTAISAHETANGFDNDGFTMTGTADIRITTPSTGYTQASGNANVFFNTLVTGYFFQISGINTLGQTGLELSYGMHKNTTLNPSDLLILECSSDGVSYQQLNYTVPSGAGTNSWFYCTATGQIPATANLRIRFRQAAITPTTQFRIDDIRLSADDYSPTINASSPAYICNGNTVTLSAPTEPSYLWSTGSTLQNISTSNIGTYNCTMTSINGCTATSNNIILNDSTPLQYTVTGGGNYCSSPGTGVLIGLSSSQSGYNYQLYNGVSPTGSSLPGTGSSLNFGLRTSSGSYSVVATYGTTSCTKSMLNTVNVSSTTATTYYADTDGDGFGNPAAPALFCSATAGYVLNNNDCNDTTALVSPNATEICNNIDDDCDGYIDEGCGTPKYCIGPSASYTPPSGPSYVNQFSPFATVKAAVTFLNSFSPTQHVIFEIQNNYTGAGETFPITLTYQGNALATAVFRPRSDVSSMLTISGIGFGLTGGLIEFSGADFITFDGSPGGIMGSNSFLRIRNTTTSNANANFSLTNDATNNIINAITIEGGKSSYHCIFFGYSPGTTGNDFNIIRNNIISDRTDAAVTAPEVAIHSSSLATGAAANSDNEITNNKIINISDGVKLELDGNEGAWNISNNHFYYTNNLLPTKISEAISVSSKANLTANISSNYIGGTAPFAGGLPLIENSTTTATSGIFLRIQSATTKSTISGNIIKNMNRPGIGNVTFTGITVQVGPADIIDNIIGDPAVENDLSFGTSNEIYFRGIRYTSTQNLFNISISGNKIINVLVSNTVSLSVIFLGVDYSNPNQTTVTSTITNNLIQSINYGGRGIFTCLNVEPSENAVQPIMISGNVIEKINLSNVNGGSFKGISCEKANASLIGNRIGSITNPNDISIASASTHYGISLNYVISGNGLIQNDTVANFTLTNTSATNRFIGIYSYTKGSLINEVSNNIVKDITTHSIGIGTDVSQPTDFAINGILYKCAGTSGLTVSNNLISGLNAVTTSSLSNTVISGLSIQREASGLLNVTRNNIHSITNTCTSSPNFPMIFGIRFTGQQSNSTIFSNNMISLINGINTNQIDMYGIYDLVDNGQVGNSKNYYFNSVSISGINSGISRSSAFWQNASNATISLRNNILHNTRTGTGNHYAIVHELGNTSAWTSSDYNNLYTLNSAILGAFPLATSRTFTGWKTASLGDSHSKNVVVNFVSNIDLHLTAAGNCTLEGSGINISGQSSDFDSENRNLTTPDIGADEFISVCFTVINIKAFIQGFYLSGGTMISALNPLIPSSNCDTIILQLAQSTTPYSVLFTDTAIIQTNGSVQFKFPSTVSGNNYYFILKHRNALKTWSANAVTISNGITYDFSNAANKAFSSNQKFLETGVFGLYSGDVNQDGSINYTDYTLIENLTPSMSNGYYPFDLTGDHQIESSDFSLIENNAQLLINVAAP